MRFTFIVALATLLAGCASEPAIETPPVPADLQPPAEQVAFLKTSARGFQLYECVLQPDQAYAWVFRAPEAFLLNDAGESIGKHYAGPTWESVDQSKVVGEVKVHVPSPSPDAIPWLRLSAKSTSGAGVFDGTKTVLRLDTTGGVAPTEGCGTNALGVVVKVPYRATYYFYR